MSFNLRYENSLDKGEISWEARKNKVTKQISSAPDSSCSISPTSLALRKEKILR